MSGAGVDTGTGVDEAAVGVDDPLDGDAVPVAVPAPVAGDVATPVPLVTDEQAVRTIPMSASSRPREREVDLTARSVTTRRRVAGGHPMLDASYPDP